jgi:hypothetical protein
MVEKTELQLSQQNIQSEEAKTHSAESWQRVLTGLKALVEKG